MARLSFTAAADDDLFDIGRYITEESGDRAIADAFLVKIFEKCARLAALPGTLGQARPELRADMRKYALPGIYDLFPL